MGLRAATKTINSAAPMRLVPEQDKERANIIVKEYGDRKSSRNNWNDLYEEVAQLFIPNKDDVFSQGHRSTGDRKAVQLLDTTGAHSAEVLANTLHSMLTNPSSVWLALQAKLGPLNDDPSVTKWLQILVRDMVSMLNQTNFQTQIHECYKDLVTFGTGPFEVLEDDEFVARFKSRPIYNYYTKENDKGIIDDSMTEIKMTVEQAFQKFGEEAFRDEAEELKKDVHQHIFIIHAVSPRDSAKRLKYGSTSRGHAFESIWVWKDKPMILAEGGFQEFPIMFPRWSKLSDEELGRSPSMTSLPDAKMLNTMMRTTIRGAQKMVDPATQGPDDGFLGQLNMAVGAHNVYRSGTPDRIETIETKGRPDIGLDLIESYRDQVKKNFFIDQLQLNIGPQMTATEVNARIEQQLRLLGPLLGRLHFELLQPMVARILKIMQRKNLLPADPPASITQGDFQLEVFFTSAIAQAQRAQEADKLRTFLASVGEMAQQDPSVKDVVKTDETVREIGKLEGVNEKLLRTDDELQEFRETKQAELEEQQRKEDELRGAEVIQKAGPTALKAGGLV